MKIAANGIFLVVLGFAFCLPIGAADLDGKWMATFDTQIGEQHYTFTFKVEGEKLTGKAKSDFADTEIQEGVIKGDELSFVEMLNFQDQLLRIEYKGKLSGDEIKLTRKVGDVATEQLVAKRIK